IACPEAVRIVVRGLEAEPVDAGDAHRLVLAVEDQAPAGVPVAGPLRAGGGGKGGQGGEDGEDGEGSDRSGATKTWEAVVESHGVLCRGSCAERPADRRARAG